MLEKSKKKEQKEVGTIKRLEGSDEHPDVSSDATWDHGGFLYCAATRKISGSMTLQGL